MKKQIALIKLVCDFLDKLSEEELNQLIEKKLDLKIEKNDEVEKNKNRTLVDIFEICQNIESFSNRNDAFNYIRNLSITKRELKEIAKKYYISIGSKDSNDTIMEKIVENVVGSKLKFDALLNTNISTNRKDV